MSHRHLHRGMSPMFEVKDTKIIWNDKTFSRISIKKGPGLFLSLTIIMSFASQSKTMAIVSSNSESCSSRRGLSLRENKAVKFCTPSSLPSAVRIM